MARARRGAPRTSWRSKTRADFMAEFMVTKVEVDVVDVVGGRFKVESEAV